MRVCSRKMLRADLQQVSAEQMVKRTFTEKIRRQVSKGPKQNKLGKGTAG